MSKLTDTGDRCLRDSGAEFHMQAIVSFEGDSIHMRTHTYTTAKVRGFHGSVAASLLHSDGRVLCKTTAGPYLVNGRWLGKSDRWDDADIKVDPVIGCDTDRIDVWIGQTPAAWRLVLTYFVNRMLEFLRNAIEPTSTSKRMRFISGKTSQTVAIHD